MSTERVPERRPARTRETIVVLLLLALAAALVLELTRGSVSLIVVKYVGEQLNGVAEAIAAPHALDGWRLYGVAFAGGLIASVSPCILGMLPLNVAYIGAAKPGSRVAAVRLATLFVAGVALVNVILGLTSALFFAVFTEFRGQINIVVGVLTVVAALWMAGALRVRVPTIITRIPTGIGPFAVGLAFALITSPCASPVLFAVLAVAARDENVSRAVVTMIVYSVGYTATLWVASVWIGFVAVSRRVLRYGQTITRAAALALALLGAGTAVYGIALLR